MFSISLEIPVVIFYSKFMENQLIRTFGRIHGKKLSARQSWLVDNLLPKLAPGPANDRKILEIGFGGGEHLLELSAQNPDATIIGAEPFINGVASLLSNICSDNLTGNHETIVCPSFQNIRIWPDDVRKLFADQPDMRFDEIWVLHPDPWPKARHEKRRLLSAGFLANLGEMLAPTGMIIIGTDHYEYYDWIMDQVGKTNLATADYKSPIVDTRYKQKNMAQTATPKYIVLKNS